MSIFYSFTIESNNRFANKMSNTDVKISNTSVRFCSCIQDKNKNHHNQTRPAPLLQLSKFVKFKSKQNWQNYGYKTITIIILIIIHTSIQVSKMQDTVQDIHSTGVLCDTTTQSYFLYQRQHAWYRAELAR